jgi:hypothetical protein
MNTTKADQMNALQSKIYRTMPLKKKAAIWSAFFKAGKLLNSLENDRRRPNKSTHRNRQNS